MGSRSTGGRRGAPARVFFFPKRRSGRRGTPYEFASPISRTLPELSLLEDPEEPEHATEPAFASPFADAEPARGARSRRRTREHAIVADEVVTEEVSLSTEGGPYAGLSRREIAEVSLFGHGLFESGRIDEARQVFEQLVASGAQDAFVHTMLGTIYLAQKAPDRALALFESALGIDPDDLAARVYRGEIRLNRGETAQAIQDLTHARDKGPKGDPFTERAQRLLKRAEAGRKRR